MQSAPKAQSSHAPAAGEIHPGSAALWRALRLAPLAVVLIALALCYAFGLADYSSLETLRHYRQDVAAFVSGHPLLAPALYVLAYAALVAVSFPAAGFLTIVGGGAFGAGPGTALAAPAAVVGATLVFLIARTSLGGMLTARAGSRVQRLQQGFQDDAFLYLLFLRLVPLFPFWLVNLAAALFGMRLLPYVAGTAIGILPATFVLAYFGEGLGSTLESESAPVSRELWIGLVLLGLLALSTAVLRRWRRGRANAPEEPGRPHA